MLELDVHGSKESDVVIIHDAALERTTNGRGRVKNRPLEELRELDAGYWFTKKDQGSYPFRGQKIKIPTLEEFLIAFPEAKAIIEIKQGRPPIVRKTLDIIRRLGREDNVLLATEKDHIMREIRKEVHKSGMSIATGFSYGEVAAFMKWVASGKKPGYVPPGQAMQIPCEYKGMGLVTEPTLQGAHELGVEMFVWTVNEVEEMKRLVRLGVDGIITDYPARLCSLLSRNGR